MRRTKTKREKETGLIERKKVIGVDPMTGKKIYHSFYGRGRRAEEQIDEKYKAFMLNQELIAESNETLAAVCEHWMENCKRPVVSDLTYTQTYEYSLKIITRYFEDQPIAKVKQADIQKFFVANRGRNKWAIDKLYYILKNTFDYAIQNDLIVKTPFIDIRKYGKPPKQKQAYDEEAYFKCIAFAKMHPDGLGPFIILKSGLRRGELCALRWSDIDLPNKIINVRRAVTFKDGSMIITQGKTRNAVRQIPIDTETAEFLAAAERKSPCVVGHGQSDHTDPKNYARRDYHRFITDFSNETGYPVLSLHELRHTYGTMLYRFHTPLEAIAKVMGHSSLELTRKIYVHDTVDDLKSRIIFPTI